mmetsp:Transcript_11853/g.36128  ORF Transcript_11853/g.36128 Transcript_11853/m.36128 type:complete len:445 (+) Transcript_11853:432-1766(+)
MSVRRLYRAVADILACPATLLNDSWKGHLNKKLFRERRGAEPVHAADIWFQSASVGEAAVAFCAASALCNTDISVPVKSLLFTSENPTGASFIRSRDGADLKNVRFQALCSPSDSAWAVRRVLVSAMPRIGVFVQSSIWPNAIFETSALDVPQVLIDGRLSEKSLWRWKTFAPRLASQALNSFERVLAISAEEAERFRKLGCKSVEQATSLKFSMCSAPRQNVIGPDILKLLAERNVWMAVSTHAGEEKIVQRVHEMLKERCKRSSCTSKPPLLILAPRHISRSRHVVKSCGDQSILLSHSNKLHCNVSTIVVDQLGVLQPLLARASVAFIGNSLLSEGRGHNFIEPLYAGCAVVHGPNMGSFNSMLQECNALTNIRRAVDSDSMLSIVEHYLQTPQDELIELGRIARHLIDTLGARARQQLCDAVRPILNSQARSVENPSNSC